MRRRLHRATCPRLEAYEEAVDECAKYATEHEAEASSVSFSWFVDAAQDLEKEAKSLMRRKRDNKPWTKRELANYLEHHPQLLDGHPVNIWAKYNELVNKSNGLNWTRYEPST